MYDRILELLESYAVDSGLTIPSAEITGLVTHLIDSEMGIDDWLDKDISPKWSKLGSKERERLYKKMLSLTGRSY